MTTYTYNKEINSDKLLMEIQTVLNLNLNGTDGSIFIDSEVHINTNNELNPTQKATLDSIVSAHTIFFPEMEFNSELFLTRFSQVFSSLERLELARKAPSFTIELMYHNFSEIKQIKNYLLQNDDISEIQASLIVGLFEEQNINLDSY